MAGKRFNYEYVDDKFYDKGFFLDNGKRMFKDEVLNTLNELHEDLKHELSVSKALRDVVKELLKENKKFKKALQVAYSTNLTEPTKNTIEQIAKHCGVDLE